MSITTNRTGGVGNKSGTSTTVLFRMRKNLNPRALNDTTIRTAVADALALDPTGNTAIPVYGLMSNWNTSQVTSMSALFLNQSSFN